MKRGVASSKIPAYCTSVVNLLAVLTALLNSKCMLCKCKMTAFFLWKKSENLGRRLKMSENLGRRIYMLNT